MTRLTIALTGDIYPTRPLAPLAPQVRSVFDLLRTADLALGNFEISLSAKGAPLEKLLAIRADPTVAKDLSELGLDMVTVANNHSMDYGWEALQDSIERLKEAGVKVVGAGRTIAEARRPLIVTVQGKRIGVIGFSCLLPTGTAAAGDRPGLSPIHIHTAYEIDPTYQMEEPGDLGVVKVRTWPRTDDLDEAASAVSKLKAACDIVVVSVHWGFGSGDALADYQLPLAKALIEAGADAVHGHHPHSVHAIGYCSGKPVFFSPNVLVGQQVLLPASPQVKRMWSEMSVDGYVALLGASENGEVEIELVPTVLDNERLPRLANGADYARILERLTRLSAPHGARITDKGERIGVAQA